MARTLRWLLVLPLLGCFTVRHEYSGDKLLTAGPTLNGRAVTKVRHFQVHDRQFFWIHGGFPVGEDLNGAALAAREAGTHAGVVNLRLADGQDIVDMGISHIACVLTLLCGTWSVWVEGDVVDYAELAEGPR
jgi:hypothetical protein